MSSSTRTSGTFAPNTCIKIVLALHELFDKAGVDKGRGINHARKVLDHANNALALSKIPENESDRQAIRYAALLHDADDKKYFPQSNNHQNTRYILNQVLPGKNKLINLVVKMIRLTNPLKLSDDASSHRLTNPLKLSDLQDGEIVVPEWMLIPRNCIRLESIGEIGILRAWTHCKRANLPLFLPTTPRVTNEEELNKITTPERFAKYLRLKKSDSMIDYFYDNLLQHISTANDTKSEDNPYLRSELQRRYKVTVEFVLQFGRDGNIDIRNLNRLRALI